MNNFQSILSNINETLNLLPDWNNLEQFVREFPKIWLKLGNFVQQQLVQARIEETETKYQSPSSRFAQISELFRIKITKTLMG